MSLQEAFAKRQAAKSGKGKGVQNTVICNLCGGKFFPASLGFHQKACAQKQRTIEVPCVYCDQLFRRDDMEHHLMKNCPERKAAALRQKKASHSSGAKSSTMKSSASSGKIKLAAGSAREAAAMMSSSSSSSSQLAKHSTAPAGLGAPLGSMAQMDAMSLGTAPAEPDGRVQCGVCSRKFAADRIGAHQRICRKIRAKADQRGVYNVGEKRMDKIREQMGVSSAPPPRRLGRGGKVKSAQPNRWGGPGDGQVCKEVTEKEDRGAKKTNWRQQHASFQAHVKNARKIQKHMDAGGDVRDLPVMQAPPGAEDPLLPCQHCGRTFSAHAHARHEPKCKSIINKARPPPTFNRFR